MTENLHRTGQKSGQMLIMILVLLRMLGNYDCYLSNYENQVIIWHFLLTCAPFSHKKGVLT